MAGTPGYQAPEQLKAERVGVYSDVYAFGCIILVLYSGIPIWPAWAHTFSDYEQSDNRARKAGHINSLSVHKVSFRQLPFPGLSKAQYLQCTPVTH